MLSTILAIAFAHAPVGAGTNDAALVIGINDYVFVEKVPGATDNARDWYLHLTGKVGVPASRVFALYDREATAENIVEQAKRAAAAVQQGGRLWLVYVGHGAPLVRTVDGKLLDPEGGLIGVDAQQTAASLEARSVSLPKLLEVLNAGPQRETVAIIDACFSGKTSRGSSLAPGLQPLLALRSKAVARVIQLSAGSSDQFAGPLPGYDRPAFSFLALGALKGWADKNADGVVTSREVIDYTNRVMAVAITDRNQRPELQGDDVQLAPSLGEAGPTDQEFVERAKAKPAATSIATATVADSGSGRRTAGWVIFGAGAAIAAAAGITGFVALDTANRSRDATTPQTQVGPLFQQARTLATLADIGYVTAGVSAIAGIVLVLLSPSPQAVISAMLGDVSGGSLVVKF